MERPSGGWHWAEWSAEALGTAILFAVGFCVVALLISPQSPFAGAVHGVRFLLVGLNFGVLSALIAVSPLGRRSGAHLNPAVTIAFWLRGDVHRHDLAGYTVAQFAGALAGTATFTLVAGDWARAIHHARTTPAPVGAITGTLIEAMLTAGLLLTVFACLARPRLQPWTPALVAVALTALIWVGSPATGASLNPARSLWPALIDGDTRDLWVYFAGPAIGALIAAVVTSLVGMGPLTAKLAHGPHRGCLMRCWLAQPAEMAVAPPKRGHRNARMPG